MRASVTSGAWANAWMAQVAAASKKMVFRMTPSLGCWVRQSNAARRLGLRDSARTVPAAAQLPGRLGVDPVPGRRRQHDAVVGSRRVRRDQPRDHVAAHVLRIALER